MSAAVDQNKIFTEDNIRVAFNLFDQNGNGEINIDEFLRAMP